MTITKDNFSEDLEQIRRNEIENLELIEAIKNNLSEFAEDIEAIRIKEAEVIEIIDKISMEKIGNIRI